MVHPRSASWTELRAPRWLVPIASAVCVVFIVSGCLLKGDSVLFPHLMSVVESKRGTKRKLAQDIPGSPSQEPSSSEVEAEVRVWWIDVVTVCLGPS